MKILLVAIAVIAGLVGTQVNWRSFAQPPLAAAQRLKPAPDYIAANGIVEGARPEIALRLEVPGRLNAIFVQENGEVERGTVLAELENSSQKQQVAWDGAELARARADLDKLRNGERPEKKRAQKAIERAKHALLLNARSTFDRSRPLWAKGAVSKEEFDRDFHRLQQAEAEWDQAKAELEFIEAPPRSEDVAAAEARVAATEARLMQARAELAKTRLTAPCNGRILQRFAEPGEMAGPASAQPVFVMADLSKRRVRAFVEELDIARIQTGQKSVVTVDALPGKEIAGTVAELLPRMGKRSPHSDVPGEYHDVHYREVLIDLSEPGELPVNLRVRVQINAALGDESSGSR